MKEFLLEILSSPIRANPICRYGCYAGVPEHFPERSRGRSQAREKFLDPFVVKTLTLPFLFFLCFLCNPSPSLALDSLYPPLFSSKLVRKLKR
jgi:hypothetical protein